MKTIFILLVLSTMGFADDVYYKNGCTVKNVTIVQTSGNFFVMKKSDGSFLKVDRKMVDHYDRRVLKGDTVFENCKDLDSGESYYQQKIKYKPEMFFISALGLTLAIDKFIDANDLSADIDDLKELEFINKDLIDKSKRIKNRKIIFGSIFAAVAVISLFKSYEEIEVKPTSNGISLSYAF